MTKTLYTSARTFYVITDAGVQEYESERISGYINTIKKIQKKNEWKTSGTGARFMGLYEPQYDEDVINRNVSINGVSGNDKAVIYSAQFGEVSGLFIKVLHDNMVEGLVMSSQDVQLYKLSVHGDKCVASVGRNGERHIALFNIKTGEYKELTEGEVIEDYPNFSNDGNKIYYSSAGLALSHSGFPIGIGPYSIFCYSNKENDINELLASESYDFIAPKEDKNGDLLFIKRPYRRSEKNGNIFLDIIMFPVRIIRAIGGLLNYFSIIFGGESLMSGKNTKDIKAKNRNEKDIFFDGNVINAQEAQKAKMHKGEKFPGIIPRSWELTRMDKNGNQICIKTGVMDYTICQNGDILYSNGNAIIRLLTNGSEELIEKCSMANNLVDLSQ